MGIMTIVASRGFQRVVAVVLMTLALAACATGKRAEYHPAPTAYFSAPIHSGDSVASVSGRYQVKQDDVVVINELPSRDARLSGRTIRVPAYGRIREAQRAPAHGGARGGRGGKGGAVSRGGRGGRAVVEVRSLPPPDGKGKSGARVAKDEPAGQRKGTRKPEPKPAGAQTAWWEVIAPPAGQSGAKKTFLWPVSGNVISSFGQAAGGERNDGINISAPRGTPVRAADAGTVTYVGNELKGYGNLVLIRHQSGYVTAYAHSDSVAVSRGEHVQRGQVIAHAGATGDVNQPQVHFELRFNTKPVDPVPYLVVPPSRMASVN
jgi:murein DD-endopeptidase MepM/ murein hydrolase activator NlpD